MIELFSTFLSSLKQTSPVLFLGLAIACGIILFGGGSFIADIGLLDFRESNLPLLGGMFVVSISILVAQLIAIIYKLVIKFISYLQSRKRKKIKHEAMISELSMLTPDEKSYLTPFIHEQKASINFLIADGIAGSLERKRIISKASTVGDMLSGWAYNIQPWAREHLEVNSDLLDGASDQITRRFPSRY